MRADREPGGAQIMGGKRGGSWKAEGQGAPPRPAPASFQRLRPPPRPLCACSQRGRQPDLRGGAQGPRDARLRLPVRRRQRRRERQRERRAALPHSTDCSEAVPADVNQPCCRLNAGSSMSRRCWTSRRRPPGGFDSRSRRQRRAACVRLASSRRRGPSSQVPVPSLPAHQPPPPAASWACRWTSFCCSGRARS